MDLLPLFPLPNAVLFPNVFLPLHIFEPRYRAMVADALEGDRLVGMVLLRPGWQADYDGCPPVYPIGCIGVITHAARMDDGRFNIVLRGVGRFRIVEENHEQPYRRAIYETLSEKPLSPDDRLEIARQRERLEGVLAPAVEQLGPRHAHHSSEIRSASPRTAAGLNDEELVNALAQYLDFDPLEKLALLERNGLNSRAEALVELIEMKMMLARSPHVRRVDH
ncbi:MAG: LON peptidase substrate-binding domain-containing protein [Vicinamibacterales bacterium]